MALTYTESQYVIPRGRVFISIDGIGERFFGNVNSFPVAVSSEKAEHYSSTGGMREKDASVQISVTRTATMAADSVSVENLAVFVSGSASTFTQSGATISNEVLSVTQGYYYQIGATTANPAGARNISGVAVEVNADTWAADTAYSAGDVVKPTVGTHYYRCTVAGTSHAMTEPTWPTDGTTVTDNTATWEDAGTLTWVADTDYNLDAATGRIQILTADATYATPIHVDYTTAAATWDAIRSGSTAEISGAMRVIADNAAGPNRDWYFPSVTISPNGDLPVITDATEFISMQFNVEILKPANQEAIYIDGRPA